MLLAILAVWFGYKKANDSGRNGVLWAAICGAAFLGVQFMVGVGVGLFMGAGIALWGWNESVYEDNQIFITIAALVAAI